MSPPSLQVFAITCIVSDSAVSDSIGLTSRTDSVSASVFSERCIKCEKLHMEDLQVV